MGPSRVVDAETGERVKAKKGEGCGPARVIPSLIEPRRSPRRSPREAECGPTAPSRASTFRRAEIRLPPARGGGAARTWSLFQSFDHHRKAVLLQS